MHLKSLRINNFRMLERLEVEKLGRVNLIVGRNNCGKSTVLEALRIYAGGANPALLEEISLEHDEKYLMDNFSLENKGYDLPFEHFFSGRIFPSKDGFSIYIGENTENLRSVYIEHVFFTQEEENIYDSEGDVQVIKKRKVIPKATLTDSFDKYPRNGLQIIQNNKTKIFNIERSNKSFSSLNPSAKDFLRLLPCSFIPTQFVSMDELADIWDKILFTE